MNKDLKKISTVNMSREEWLSHRKGSIGGSDAAAIIGLNDYASAYSVWAEKLGKLPEQEDNEAMRIGRDLEEYVAKRFTEKTGLKVKRENAIIYNPQYPFAHANIDRRIVGEDANKELIGHLQDGVVELNRTRYSHFSIDDFYLAFQDLTENADTYTSVFDNATFAWLKTFHETTGATISCYCFYQDAGTATFTLDDVPTKYASEFKENKDWLRFGFHALYQGINYASATAETAKAAYEQTITALIKITGSSECIDRMPRLHNFAGSLEACQGMRDALCGPKGFLAAISASDGTARQSYYLDETYNNYIFIHDYLYDAVNQLHFVRTQDGGNVYQVSKFASDINYALLGTYVEFFTHENQLTDGIKSAFKSAYNKLKTTHRPVFWMDIFR